MFNSFKKYLTDVFERAKSGKTRIASLDWISAARHGKLTELKKLAEKTNIDAQDDLGRTALHSAAGNGQFAVVKFLLDAGARTDIRDNTYGAVALHAAATSKNPAVQDLLISRTADLNVWDKNGETPYQYAHRHNPENAKTLKAAGANAYVKKPEAWSWGPHPGAR